MIEIDRDESSLPESPARAITIPDLDTRRQPRWKHAHAAVG